MIALRRLLPFGFLALLGGCSSGPCVGPGELSKLYSEVPIHSCYYELTVTSIDHNNYFVKGKAPKAPEGPSKESPEYTFRVRDLDKVEKQIQEHIKNQKPLYFIRDGNSAYLELFVEKPNVRE